MVPRVNAWNPEELGMGNLTWVEAMNDRVQR